MSNEQKNTAEEYAFIGGGSMGPIQLIYLASLAKHRGVRLDNTTFHCYDPQGFGNGGIAYGQAHEQYKLNSVRTEMSPWDVLAFHRYCQKHFTEEPLSPTLAFNNRVLYKEFLEEQYADAVRTIQELGGNVEEHREYVSIKKSSCESSTDNHFVISKANTQQTLLDIAADHITLTVGYGPNNNFPNLMKWNGDGYTHSIYEVEADEIPQDTEQTILVIGAGPALFDFANRFEAYADKTRLIIVSQERTDLDVRDLSTEITETNYHPAKLIDSSLTIKTSDQLKDAISTEFNEATQQGFTKRRAALDIIKSLPQIICSLSADERHKYVCSPSYKALLHHATPVPEHSHAVLNKYDTVSVTERLSNQSIIRLENGKFQVTFGSCSSQQQKPSVQIEVDQIVNATGHGRTNAPILDELITQGLASHIPGLNVLQTDESGYRLAGSEISCVGPSVHFGTDGIETFSILAEKRAHEILDQILLRHNASSVPQIKPAQEHAI